MLRKHSVTGSSQLEALHAQFKERHRRHCRLTASAPGLGLEHVVWSSKGFHLGVCSLLRPRWDFGTACLRNRRGGRIQETHSSRSALSAQALQNLSHSCVGAYLISKGMLSGSGWLGCDRGLSTFGIAQPGHIQVWRRPCFTIAAPIVFHIIDSCDFCSI